jgi:hypothetical protein
MLYCIILLIAIQILTPICVFLTIRRYIESKQAETEHRIEAALHDWIDPTPDGKPSKLAVSAEAIGAVIGSAAARSIMSNLAQLKSSEAQAANGIAGGLEAQQNPLLAIIGTTRKGKGAAFQRLIGYLGPMLMGKGNGTGGGSPPSQQGSFSL